MYCNWNIWAFQAPVYFFAVPPSPYLSIPKWTTYSLGIFLSNILRTPSSDFASFWVLQNQSVFCRTSFCRRFGNPTVVFILEYPTA
jgi:hypothetical protein